MLTDDTLAGLLAGITTTRRCTTFADVLACLPVGTLARLAGGRMTWRGYVAALERMAALWARDYVEATPPAGLADELDAGGWTVRPVDAGQIVERAYSGRDGCPGWSPWLRVADRSDGSARYYVRRDLADELERYGARAC